MQTGQGASLNGRPPVKCAACGREFVRRSRSRSLYCSPRCRRRAKADRERAAYAESRATTGQVVSRTVTELRAQIEHDERHQRPAQWPVLQARVAGLVDARAAMVAGETGASFAYRQSLLDCASAAVQMAARMPRPTVKLQSDGQVGA